VLGVNPQVISQAGSTEHNHTDNQAKLDNSKLWSSFGCPRGHDLDSRAIHSTYYTSMGLIWEFLKGNTHRNKKKSRSVTWVA
jgi:hypothetical protein